MIKKWIKLEILVSTLLKDTVSHYLIELGSTGIEETQDGIIAYFVSDDWNESLLQEISYSLSNFDENGFATNSKSIRIKEQDHQDWIEGWKKYYKPVKITGNISVSPPWIKTQNKDMIFIDPGMAFGTGTHETTQLVLILLEKYIRKGDFVCDVGTGSGILAIASVKLGAAGVLAFDNDIDALKNAKDNIRINKIGKTILLINTGIAPFIKRKFNLVLANINYDVLIDNKSTIKDFLKPEGHLIVSGILSKDVDRFNSCLEERNIKLIETKIDREWAGLVYGRLS